MSEIDKARKLLVSVLCDVDEALTIMRKCTYIEVGAKCHDVSDLYQDDAMSELKPNPARDFGANMKYLYKLKLNGKTVGYMKWVDRLDGKGTRITGMWVYSPNRTLKYSKDNPWLPRLTVLVDTIHAYVTDDKNGKPVFVGDRIRMYFREGMHENGYVEYDSESFRFVFRGPDNETYGFCTEENIELIEESE